MEDTAKPLADAESFEEFKALRYKPAEKAEPEPAAEKKEPIATPPSDTGSESAEDSETSETNSPQQEEHKPGKERSLEARVKELRAKGEHEKADKILREAWTKEEKARADRLEEELRTLRTRKPESEPAPQPEAKTEAKPAADPSDPEPRIDDEKYQADGGYEQYLRDTAIWAFRQEQKRAAREQQQQSFRQRAQQTVSAGRQAHADFDVVANRVTIHTGVLQEAIQRLDNAAEVLYKIGSDPAEAARIQALDPMDQWAELRVISRELAKPKAEAPPAEQPKPKPAVTKAAPPPRQLSGGRDDGELPKLSEARDFEEFKRFRARQSRAS